ncbi:MAG: NADH-quinone oxidoreductase subunit M [Bdellovibrionaceae bacterium]|nr:NADH-quinone oxidoreductase subunit M [Pseudobdellovibrionaceae bacterium]
MILTLLIVLPLLAALMLLPMKNEKGIRVFSLVSSGLMFILSLCALSQFDKTSADFQLTLYREWIPQFGISYFVGVDGFSILLVVLTALLTPIVIAASWTSITDRVKGFHIALFVLQAAVIGSFVSIDTVLFYLFFELSLVPMYFIVGIWGGENRIYATYKFFIYTMAGSVFMLAGIAYLMIQAKAQLGYYTADVMDLYKVSIPFVDGEFFTPQTLLFFAFAVAFAIKVPVFPVHTWLPDAHVQAPTAGSVILAGVMLKMGTYGFLRFVLPMFPEAVQVWGSVFLVLGVIGIVYGALVAMVQVDVKKLVAYSSVSHMGYVMLGLFVLNVYGLNGGLFQMLAHGVSTGGLFLMVGMVYERTHSREIAKYGGLAKAMPVFTIFFLIITFSSIAVPMTNGFVGEFLILLGTFGFSSKLGAIAVTGVVLGAAYMLWMVKKVFFGPAGELVDGSHGELKDLNCREIAALIPIVVLIFWMGVMPRSFLDYSQASVNHLVENKDNYELKIYPQPEAVAEKE